MSTGLMILTNDGELANRLAHPRYGVEKLYRVVVAGTPDREVLTQLTEGVWLAEGKVRAKRVRVVGTKGQATVLEMVLAEGKNREVRRMLAKLGHKVMSLTRIAVGPITLKGLAPGEYRPLTAAEVGLLRKVAAGISPSPRAAAPRPAPRHPSRGPRPAPTAGAPPSRRRVPVPVGRRRTAARPPTRRPQRQGPAPRSAPRTGPSAPRPRRGPVRGPRRAPSGPRLAAPAAPAGPGQSGSRPSPRPAGPPPSQRPAAPPPPLPRAEPDGPRRRIIGLDPRQPPSDGTGPAPGPPAGAQAPPALPAPAWDPAPRPGPRRASETEPCDVEPAPPGCGSIAIEEPAS